MLQLDLHPGTLQALLREIGLLNSQGDLYAARVRKHAQIGSYILQIASVLNKLSKKRPLVFLDNCCGKSYLSFVLYAYCTEVLRCEVKIVGIDRNAPTQYLRDISGIWSVSFYAVLRWHRRSA